MRIQPPLGQAHQFPVTTIVGLTSITTSALWWTGQDISHLIPVAGSVTQRPWTLVTSIFPHVDPFHLAFNVAWWWVLGTAVERTWGSVRMIGLVVLLAIISSAAEFAVSSGGVGLSGVVYGLCPLIYIAQRHYESLKGLVTRRVIELFAAWFVLCIVLTAANIMQVGNVAHAFGAIAGTMVGMCIVAGPRRRVAWIGGLVAIVAVTCAGAMVAFPSLSFLRSSSRNAYDGYVALTAGRYAEAAPLLEAAAAEQPNEVGVLMNLGITYQHLDRLHEALEVYKRVTAIDPGKRAALGPSIASILNQEARDAGNRGDVAAARSLAYEALNWNPGDEYATGVLEWVRQWELATILRRGTETSPIDGGPKGP